MPLLFTHRLQLRPFTRADLPALHALWTDRHVRRYLWDGDTVSETRAAEYLDESTADFTHYGYGMWALSLRAEPHNVVGFCGLRAHAERPFPDLVYGLGPQWWGQGLATEAAQAVAAYVFGRGLVAGIEATVDVPNTGSGQVLEKLGMESRPPTQPGQRLFYLDRERFAAWVGRPFVVQIRPVRLEDAPELARILTGALRDTFAGRVPEACLDSPTREESERNWRRSIEKPGFCEKPGFLNDEGEFLLVAEDMAGQMAGFILAGRASSCGTNAGPVLSSAT
jgi:ribosomal-protein-alanine N-acetyltransferase